MNKKQTAILKSAISHYGVNVQKVTAMEEMAELTKELSKSIRYGDINNEHIAEEIGDVEIMLEQLKIIYNNAEEVEKSKSAKIERLERRIKDGGR